MRFSLNTKVLIFFFLTVSFITLLISYIVFNAYEKTLIDRKTSELTTIRDIKKSEVEKFLAEKITDIELLAKNQGVVSLVNAIVHEVDIDQGKPKHGNVKVDKTLETTGYLQQYAQSMGLLGLHVLSIDHPAIIYSTMKEELPDINPENIASWQTKALSELYSEVASSHKSTYSDIVLYSKQNIPSLFLASAIKDKTGMMIGVMVFQFHGNDINDILTIKSHLLSKSEEFYLVGSDQLMRSNSYLDPTNRSLLTSLQQPLKGVVATTASSSAINGDTRTEFIKDYRGIDVLSAYTPIDINKRIRWALIAEVDKKDILSEIEDVKKDSFFSLIIALPLFFVLLYYLLNTVLVAPLNRLKDSITKITDEQDFTQRIQAGESIEIDAISDSFNLLLSTIAKANDEITISQELLKKGQELANIGIWEIDLENDTAFFGPGVHKILQTDPQTFKPSFDSYLSFVHPDDRKALQSIYFDAITNGAEGRFEHRLIRKNGALAYVEGSYGFKRNTQGEVVKLNGLIIDYTLRKNLEIELQTANNELEARVHERTQDLVNSLKEFEYLFNTTIEAIMISKDGVCVDTNAEALKVFGYTRKNEMIGRTMLEYVHKDSKEIVMNRQTEDEGYTYEARLVRHDGSPFPALLKRHTYTNEDGSYRIHAVMDITELKLKEQQLLQQSRHAQMGEMIAMIAHQWRQPLSSISATIGSLQMKQALDKYDKDFYDQQLQNIADYTQHLSHTIEDFRDFFKDEKMKTRIRLEDIAADSIAIIEPLLENKNITLKIDYQSNETTLTYPNELKQVFLNILKNAQEVLIEKKVNTPVIELSTYKDEEYLYFSIQDNAGGIPEEIIDKVFDPYFTTKGQLHGTGLGLYMSHKIIDEHCHGSLMVKNSDSGALFIGKIPRVAQDNE